MRALILGGVIVAVAVTIGPAPPVRAQEATAGSPRVGQMQTRFKIAVMESVLEQAVQLGARRLSAQVQEVSPDLLFIAGSARARGFWLDGYGVFFDVDVPAMRRSLAWSFRMLDRPGAGDSQIDAALRSLKREVESLPDSDSRRQLQAVLRKLETAVAPPQMAGPGVPTVGPRLAEPVGLGSTAPAPAPPVPSNPILDDPGLAYTTEVQRALIDAMLEYGTPIPVADSEWFAVAARGASESRLGDDNPYDASTFILRIRGGDLASYRAGRITREEARTRVEIREY